MYKTEVGHLVYMCYMCHTGCIMIYVLYGLSGWNGTPGAYVLYVLYWVYRDICVIWVVRLKWDTHLVYMSYMGHVGCIGTFWSRGSDGQWAFVVTLCHDGLRHVASYNLMTYCSLLGACLASGFHPGVWNGTYLGWQFDTHGWRPWRLLSIWVPHTFCNDFMCLRLKLFTHILYVTYIHTIT